MKNESLNGTLVLVRSENENDPAAGRGKVALVNYDRNAEEIYVAFNDGREGVYTPDDLLKLRDKNAILNELTRNGSTMPLTDFKDLYKITLLLDRGTGAAQWQALEIARNNPAIVAQALEPAQPTARQVLERSYAR